MTFHHYYKLVRIRKTFIYSELKYIKSSFFLLFDEKFVRNINTKLKTWLKPKDVDDTMLLIQDILTEKTNFRFNYANF